MPFARIFIFVNDLAFFHLYDFTVVLEGAISMGDFLANFSFFPSSSIGCCFFDWTRLLNFTGFSGRSEFGVACSVLFGPVNPALLLPVGVLTQSGEARLKQASDQ